MSAHRETHDPSVPRATRARGERPALDWDDVRVFLAAARGQSFGAAARALDTQQSTVSRRIARLERALGVLLFDRRTSGLALTAAGQRVCAEAERADVCIRTVRDVADAEATAVRGTVRVALSETLASAVVLPRVLPTLLAKHPALAIELVTSDDPADLSRREADLAVRFFLPPKGDLVARRVGRLATAPLAHRALARRLRARAPDLWPWVSVSRAGRPVAEERWMQSLGARPRLTTTSFHAQFEAVCAGLGVAVLPVALRRVRPMLEALEVEALGATPPLELVLVTPRALRRVPKVSVVFDALERELSALV